MRRLPRIDLWSQSLLSLIVLTANIGAPFRTSAGGRAFLENLSRHAATCSVIRVRTTSPVGASHGFRAVVGFAKGGPDGPDPERASRPSAPFLQCRTVLQAGRPFDRPIARPSPPLRC